MLHIDFETRSCCDLRKYGVDVYSRHATTEVLCLGWAFGTDDPRIWVVGDVFPEEIIKHVSSGGEVMAHNAAFEYAIWNNVLIKQPNVPPLKLHQIKCTMAMAYAASFPGSLENCANALKLPQGKDAKGRQVMLSLSKPRSFDDDHNPVWWDDPEKTERLHQYCIQDVILERQIADRLRRLTERESRLWILDQKINLRGVGIDILAIQKSKVIIKDTLAKLNREVQEITKYRVTDVTQVAKMLAYIQGEGVNLPSLAKPGIEEIKKDTDLPDHIRRLLQLRLDGAKTSVAKLDAMAKRSLIDRRARNLLQYHGATTGRWAGRGIQIQNLPRPEHQWSDPKLQDEILTKIVSGELDANGIERLYGPAMRVLSSCTRAYIRAANGYKLIGADLSNNEGRVLAWLAGEKAKLETFRKSDTGEGPDVHTVTACGITGKDYDAIDEFERLAYGKVPELAMGYQGGVGAFQSMSKLYGIDISDEKAEAIKIAWRQNNPNIQNYWKLVEQSAILAVKNKGQLVNAGTGASTIQFFCEPETLYIRLPSKTRCLAYAYPELKLISTSWGSQKEALTYKGVNINHKWADITTYGGKLVENIAQAVARDVLVECMWVIEAKGYPIIFHVHDEIVAEVPEDYGSVDDFVDCMSLDVPWGEGLPLAAKGWSGTRFRK